MPNMRHEAGGISMTNHHFCCSECGAHFDLSTKYGRKAAQYGLCGKCGVEFVIRTYDKDDNLMENREKVIIKTSIIGKSNFLAKVFFFIPYILIKIRYNKVYKTELQAEKLIEELSSEPIKPSVPKFNSDFSEFEWNGIVYKIPQKYYGMPVNEDIMKKIATDINEEQEMLARIAQAELDIYERFEQNDDDFLNEE